CGSVLAAFVVSLVAVVQLASIPPVPGAVHGAGELSYFEYSSTGSRAESFVVDTHKPACLVYYWTWLPSMELEQERDAGAWPSWPGPLPLNRSADLEIPPRFRIDFGFLLDPLSSIMILVITGVGFLIHVYSIGYMAHDPGFARYFAYLNLFTAMMLTLVLGS